MMPTATAPNPDVQERTARENAPGIDLAASKDDLARSRAKLPPSEAHLRAVLESAVDVAIITTDLEGHVTVWNRGAQNLLGWVESEVVGQDSRITFTPEDRYASVPDAEMATALAEGRAQDERWHLRCDGSRFWAKVLTMPLRADDGRGAVYGFLKILRDRTEEKRAEDELRDTDEFLRRVLEASGDCIKVLDLDARLQFMSTGGQAVMEVDDFGTIKGCPWPDFWEGEGNVAARAALVEARAGRAGRFQGFARTAKGTPRWWDVVVTPIMGADGRPERLLSVSRDVTEERRAREALRESEKEQRLLAEELHHRVKNTLAMVQAIVVQTLRTASSSAQARDAIETRLQALASAHDLLIHGGWAGSDVRAVAQGALKPHDDGTPGRFRIEGPKVPLSAQASMAFALMLHELATNAAKYGALSVGSGHVELAWELVTEEAGPRLRLRWRERGGPPVTPPERQGFGSRLIERGLAGALGGIVRLSYDPEGVVCEVDASLGAQRDVGVAA